MNLGIEMQQQQQLRMTPQLQHALHLLQLSTLEFNQEVEAALAENPFLEATGTGTDAPFSSPSTSPSSNEDNRPSEIASTEAPPDAESVGSDWTPPMSGNDDSDWTDWSETPTSLHDQLRKQLLVWPLSDRERILAQLLIGELSDAGYLETSLEELLEIIPRENSVKLHELEAALAIVQQLEPAGIGARTLQECLLLQLAEVPEAVPGRALAISMVTEHFELLARRQFPRIEQLLGCDDTALHTARALIRTLDPRPGRCHAADETRYVIPDVIVSQSGKRWVAKMNPAAQPSIRLNRSYAELAGGKQGSLACNHMLQEARWMLRNIEQRLDTIQRVANAIVARQRVFFSHGDAAMRPMILSDIAGEIGIHESTVCRATNGKYMATPRGLFEFKYFFSRQLPARGGSCSALAIRALIRELIAAENPEQPLSDVQLARLLNDQGFGLVRRTVTKYRTQMRVPSVELRRVGHRQ